MKIEVVSDKRHLIPRWHTSRKSFSLQFSNVDALPRTINQRDRQWLSNSISEWQESKTVSSAIDLLVRLRHVESQDSQDYQNVVNYLQNNDTKITNEVRELISPKQHYIDEDLMYSTHKGDIYRVISKLKSKLRSYPNDALSWADLAFYYTSIGQNEKAKKCIDTGCNLAPENPFMVRAKSRFLVHVDQLQAAAKYLNSIKSANHNPLIASAKLSIQALIGNNKIDVKNIKYLIEKYRGQPYLISELAAGYGTLEIMNGALKKGKKSLNDSLVFPSENTISQCVWLQKKAGVDFSHNLISLQQTIEGEVTKSYTDKEFIKCRDHLVNLHAFQPFSDRSIVSAGYLCLAALDDFEFVINLSEGRVPLSDMSFLELNNLIVAYLLRGDVSLATPLMKALHEKVKINPEHSKAILYATSGLHLILSGYVDEGSMLYEKVISKLKVKKEQRQLALASYFYSRAIYNFDKEKAESLIQEAKNISKKYKIEELNTNKFFDKKTDLTAYNLHVTTTKPVNLSSKFIPLLE
ncbi:hypothetical protein [Teredinibacter waterburyi]|uniref:hypothetical protein n=1 Tax=Teredinibacter waterburyi TaxID=1500538 RepID=UPI00165F9D30|nr:hypothetical protein [Teredinibacter waterburyi]